MFIPPSFRIDDPVKLSAFMDAHSFATLVTCDSGAPFASHLPMRHYFEEGVCTTLVAHMARANAQWRHFRDEEEVLAIFTGPHAYISPSWYTTDPAVPTWNYAATHVYGIPTLLTDHSAIVAMLDETVAFYEQSFAKPWPWTRIGRISRPARGGDRCVRNPGHPSGGKIQAGAEPLPGRLAGCLQHAGGITQRHRQSVGAPHG